MVQLNLGNLCSELGKAYRDYASLTQEKQCKVDDYSKSIEWYVSALQQGKEPPDIISHLGFSWFKLGQLASEVDSISGIRNMVEWVGVNLNGKNEDEIKEEFAARCLENAFFSSSIARTLHGDSSRELFSKLGAIAFELAQREHELGNIRQMRDYILIAKENLEESMKQQFPFAYVLRAQLSDFIKEKISTESDGNPEKCKELEEIAKCGWRDCIPKIFDLINDNNNKAELIRYNKGSSVVYELVDENFPLRHAFIIKENTKEEIEKEFVITKCIRDAYTNACNNGLIAKEDVKFSRPLGLITHNSGNCLVLERNAFRSLEDIWNHKNDEERTKSVYSALEHLAKYHVVASKAFGDKTNVSQEIGTSGSVSVEIREFDCLENLVERLLVGREESSVKEAIKKLDSENVADLTGGQKRLGFNEAFKDFYDEYKLFINKHLSNCPLKVILHSDFYLGNVLEDYTLLDPKYIRKGNPLFDLAYFLENVSYFSRNSSYEETFIKHFQHFFERLSKTFSFDQEKLKEQYRAYALHNLICHVSGAFKLGKVDEASFYYNKSMNLLEEMNLTGLKEKFTKYIQNTSFYRDYEEAVYQRVKQFVDGCVQESEPRNFVEHCYNVEKWVQRINSNPSLSLRVAALTHDVERAFIRNRGRDKGRPYVEYKEEHAKQSTKIMEDFFKEKFMEKTLAETALCLIRYHEVGLPPGHPLYEDIETLKDADAIAFFEEESFDSYLKAWGEEVARDKIGYSYNRLSSRGKKLVEPLYERACERAKLQLCH